MGNTDPTHLERLFRHGRLSRRQFVQGLVAAGVSVGGIEGLMGVNALADALRQKTSAASMPYLVVMVLDAFRPDYFDLAAMPTVRMLQSRGVTYSRAWVGQMESETPVGHASLGTGSLPQHDGVIGFEWRDPASGQEILDGWVPGVVAGKLDHDLHTAGAPSIASLVKAANSSARVVSVSSEKPYAADAMGGPEADYVLFHSRKGSTGPLTPTALVGHEPPPGLLQQHNLATRFPLKHFTDWDYLSAMLALDAFHQVKPQVLMVNFPGGDVYGHPYGGPAAPALMAAIAAGIDRNIARIVQAYKQAGIFDQTVWVVTADHGMVPNDRAVDGTETKTAVRAAGGDYYFHTGGTAADIYLRNAGAAPAVSAAMTKVPNVTASYYRDNANNYVLSPGASLSPDLDAAYRFLLATFAGPTAPDVVSAFRENTIGTRDSKAHGDHGGMNWGAQHIPMIISGPGIRQNVTSDYPARLVDLAPTALAALGLSAPGMDGVVLADAMPAAGAAQVAAQEALRADLTTHQNALILQSTDNIAEDQKTHNLPPAPAPARP